ncbi:MAG TPA: hypothetical protein VIJ62_00320 [Rhizomicrobium sp.]
MRRIAIVLLCALALSGCFQTTTPLFGTKDAVYPIASGTHYVQYMLNKGSWKEQARGTITLDHGWYVARSKDDNDTIRFLLKQWGKNYLAVAQDEDNDKQPTYLYGVMRPANGAFYEYGPQCRDFDPHALQKRGIVTLKPRDEENCAPVSVDALQTIMQMVLDSSAKPDEKYVLLK